MASKRKILAISGSTRRQSTNIYLINAIINMLGSEHVFNVFNSIADIPHFNPDLDNDTPPERVVDLRKQLMEADGILICTPEYAMGVPGTLKNAIDWTVSSSEFYKKPTALITASSIGEKGHASLLETLKIIDCKMTDETQLLISFAKTKINKDSVITDTKTLNQVNDLIRSFLELMNQ